MADDDWEEDTPVAQAPRQSRTFTNSRGSGGGGRGRGYSNPRWPDNGDRNVDNTNWRTNERRDDRRPARESVTVHVPSEKVGRIIGKGGSKIRDLQFESGAHIKITDANGAEITEIVLMGSGDQTDKAKSLIEDLTKDRPPPRRDGRDQQEDANTSGEFVKKTEDGVEVIDWDRLNSFYDEHQQERWAKLPPIVKNFYKEDPAIARMSPAQVAAWRKENNDIQVRRTFEDKGGDPIPNPVLTFEQAFHNFPDILKEIYKQNFTKPSPIQSQAWPVLLKGEDMIGIAQTGTGKTLAFLLPALIHIDGQPMPKEEREGPTVLILAPTRELAIQIEKEVSKYSYRGIKSLCVYGGADRREQIRLVTKGVDIVIATPGRLNDLVVAGHLKVIGFSYIVLDEADRMLDMGFEPQIRKSLFDVRPDRQTVMTSATWPAGVRRLAETYMVNPIQVNVGSLDLAAVHTVRQDIIFVEEDEKEAVLFDFLAQMEPNDKVIVFCGKKATANHIFTELVLKGVNCQSIHGDRDQSDRELALEEMRDGSVNILIATDVASRGIDIADVTHVINLDFPRHMEEYVHRVGRTGRAGRTGVSLSFLTRQDWSHAKELIVILEEADQEVPEELQSMADRFDAMKLRRAEDGGDRRGGGGRGGGGFRGRGGGRGGGGGFGGGGGGYGGGGGGYGGGGGGYGGGGGGYGGGGRPKW